MSQIIRFEKIVPEGKAMGHLPDGRAVFTIGPIPDEAAKVGIRKQKKRYAEAVLHQIVEPSPHRTGKAEDHSLSCSPWQDVDYKHQLKLKTDMLAEAFRQHKVDVNPNAFLPAPQQFGYRNRLDFALTRVNDALHLAFHLRGTWDELVTLPHGCKLASDAMNQTALALVEKLNTLETPVDEAVLTVRQSTTNGHVLLILTTDLKSYAWPQLAGIDGATVVITRPQSGSGAPGKLVYAEATPELTEELNGLTISYPYDSFFQTNVPAFRNALVKIIEASKELSNIVELYSGVGSIGLPLAKSATKVTGIEIAETSVEYARRNAAQNNIGNYYESALPAEAADLAILSETDGLILDPPRAGLHPRITKQILQYQPRRIIYLSCNPITQARDLAALQSHYSITSLDPFDFYPGTLHMETLAALDKK